MQTQLWTVSGWLATAAQRCLDCLTMKRLLPLLIDIVCVIVFAAAGRASHGESVLGTFVTAWPFLVACAVAWIVLAMSSLESRGLRAGVIVWVVTLIGGMALRIAAGDTAEPAFIVVATLFLAMVLLGWRLIALLVQRRKAS